MQTNGVNEQTKIAGSESRPQKASTAVSSSDLAALRDKLKTLGQNIASQESLLGEDEALQATYSTEDKATLELEGVTKQVIDDLDATTGKLRDQINESSSESESTELMVAASEHFAIADENQTAYESTLKELAPAIKQEMQDDEQHSGSIQQQFKYQVKVGREAMEFWGDEKKFWDTELKAGPADSANKDQILSLYDQASKLETQINNLFGSGSKDEKDSLKAQLTAVKNQVSAVRSRASA